MLSVRRILGMPFRLLDGFKKIFEGQAYRHRSSTHGDRLARLVYEDLYTLGRSALLKKRIDDIDCVVNITNRVTGIKSKKRRRNIRRVTANGPRS
jgi:hypothetical protein